MKLPLPLAFTLALAACGMTPPAAHASPVFDPFKFFLGRSHGDAQLKIITKDYKSVSVDSVGRVDGDTLVIDQHISVRGESSKDRQWRLRRDGPGKYSGTLTEATGPVTAEVEGDRLHIRYPSKDGAVEQWLSLAPDTTYADNRLTVKKLGIVVATLEETITRRGGPM
ncbi:DUF3833 family protein [Sphingomonas antarctica]|uniref:DUF3833 family protein n=1 Tax=Sphingomonas antarctica TaxID=2040274 RepID=UPI0039E9AEE4